MQSPLRSDVQDNIGWLTLSRPERYNALDLETASALAERLAQWAGDQDIRAVVVTGEGPAFCAGGDLQWIAGHAGGQSAAFHELAGAVNRCVIAIRRMNAPVIAAINGVAAGGGFSLALACDFRVMASTAVLRQGYTSSGLCIDAGGTFMLPRLVGLARALEIAAFDEPIDSARALSWGLVTQVVPPADLVQASRALAVRLADGSSEAFRWAKRLLTDSFETPFEEQVELERRGIAECGGHPDGVEGVSAFLAKRRPRYR